MACEYDNEYKCGDSLYDLTKKILGRLKQLVGFGPGGGGGGGGDVTLTVSDVEIGAVEIKDSSTDNRATVRNTDPAATDYGLVVRNIPSGTQAVSGPFLTDAELRVTPVSVSGPLTDAQLRAAAVPISVASLPLPAGAATEATLATINPALFAIESIVATEATLQDVVTNTAGLVFDLGSIAGNTQDIRNLAFATAAAETPTFATVGVASAEAVPENLARASVYLTNTSDNVISIAFGATAVLNSGITLFPGDSFAMLRPGLNLTGAINAIAGAASSNLAIQEFSA